MAEPPGPYTSIARDFVSRTSFKATPYAAELDVSHTALIGAIANEVDTRFIGFDNGNLRLLNSFVQEFADKQATGFTHFELEQNYNKVKLGNEPTNKIDDPVTIDVGPGNIRIETAIDMVRDYISEFGGTSVDPIQDPLGLFQYANDYEKLVKDLADFEDPSTTYAIAALYLKRGKEFFIDTNEVAWNKLSADEQDALLVTYYKLGEAKVQQNINERIAEQERRGLYSESEFEYNPTGDGGQQHLNNAERLKDWSDGGCFLAGTPISMWDGSKKPIEEIEPGDWVTSYDKDGKLTPGRVTEVKQTSAAHVLDVHGLMVTPGHVTLCGDGVFAGQHVAIIDILRSDGALVRKDGSKVRAATDCPLDTDGDRFIWAVTGEKTDGGGIRVQDKGQIRLGTRIILSDGTDTSVMDLIATSGGTVTKDGLVQKGDAELDMPLFWSFGASLPKPEDYVLQRSELNLQDIYAADEWEAVTPQIPLRLD